MSSDLPALLMTVLILLSVAIVVTPLAILYAVHAGWIGFQWGVLCLLVVLCYFQMLGSGDDEPRPEFVENDPETGIEDIGGDGRW